MAAQVVGERSKVSIAASTFCDESCSKQRRGMIEVVLCSCEILFGCFGMKAVARHALALWQMLGE